MRVCVCVLWIVFQQKKKNKSTQICWKMWHCVKGRARWARETITRWNRFDLTYGYELNWIAITMGAYYRLEWQSGNRLSHSRMNTLCTTCLCVYVHVYVVCVSVARGSLSKMKWQHRSDGDLSACEIKREWTKWHACVCVCDIHIKTTNISSPSLTRTHARTSSSLPGSDSKLIIIRVKALDMHVILSLMGRVFYHEYKIAPCAFVSPFLSVYLFPAHFPSLWNQVVSSVPSHASHSFWKIKNIINEQEKMPKISWWKIRNNETECKNSRPNFATSHAYISIESSDDHKSIIIICYLPLEMCLLAQHKIYYFTSWTHWLQKRKKKKEVIS